MSCEKGCVFFQTLPPDDRRLNRKTRQATGKGEEFPGSAGSMCGSCVAIKKISTALKEQEKELKKGKKKVEELIKG